MANVRVTLFVHVEINAQNPRDAQDKAEDLKRWAEQKMLQEKAPWVEKFDVDYNREPI